MNPVLSTGLAALTLCLAASCAASSDTDDAQSGDSATTVSLAASVQKRLDELQAAVDDWQRADDLASAKAAAETARNLVTGPDVNGYGDLDGAGVTGLLPCEQGQPGLVTSPAPACVERDVLGGSWAPSCAFDCATCRRPRVTWPTRSTGRARARKQRAGARRRTDVPTCRGRAPCRPSGSPGWSWPRVAAPNCSFSGSRPCSSRRAQPAGTVDACAPG